MGAQDARIHAGLPRCSQGQSNPWVPRLRMGCLQRSHMNASMRPHCFNSLHSASQPLLACACSMVRQKVSTDPEHGELACLPTQCSCPSVSKPCSLTLMTESFGMCGGRPWRCASRWRTSRKGFPSKCECSEVGSVNGHMWRRTICFSTEHQGRFPRQHVSRNNAPSAAPHTQSCLIIKLETTLLQSRAFARPSWPGIFPALAGLAPVAQKSGQSHQQQQSLAAFAGPQPSALPQRLASIGRDMISRRSLAASAGPKPSALPPSGVI